jgi:hypothetical protein
VGGGFGRHDEDVGMVRLVLRLRHIGRALLHELREVELLECPGQAETVLAEQSWRKARLLWESYRSHVFVHCELWVKVRIAEFVATTLIECLLVARRALSGRLARA